MKPHAPLIAVSLAALVLLTLHLTHDVILQAEGSVEYPIPVVVFALWLYATLRLFDRVVGLAIILLGGLFSAAMIVVHADGLAVGKSEGFFFVWTLFALSATGWVTMMLAARGIWMRARKGSAG